MIHTKNLFIKNKFRLFTIKFMTIGIEKIFFKYILQNKKYFDIVETHYFKNNDTKYVYNRKSQNKYSP